MAASAGRVQGRPCSIEGKWEGEKREMRFFKRTNRVTKKITKVSVVLLFRPKGGTRNRRKARSNGIGKVQERHEPQKSRDRQTSAPSESTWKDGRANQVRQLHARSAGMAEMRGEGKGVICVYLEFTRRSGIPMSLVNTDT